MITESVVQQIKRLHPDRQYAIIFENPLTMREIEQIQDQLKTGEIAAKIFIISGAHIIELDKIVIVAEKVESE